ncbi:MAG TPA: rRNA maturation RNase YbeY [Candidatus Paceibacterota bacterium]|nr:rRNA maturation RNase YbeY [Candidatus Paceibacterota bacterium]
MQRPSAPLEVIQKPKGKLPRLPFALLRDEILGADYELTIAFISPAAIKKINSEYRKKDYIPNVLSFPLGKKQGEIYACLSQIKKDAPKHGEPYKTFLPFLILHSMLHLKGYAHGSRMEREEARLREKYNF